MASNSDDFTDTAAVELQNHTPSGGGSWTWESSGATTKKLVISNANRCRRSNAGSTNVTTIYSHSFAPATNEYDVTLGYKFISSTGITPMRHFGRLTATNNYYEVVVNQGGGTITLNKNASGTVTQLAQTTIDYSDGVERAVKLEIRTAAKKVYEDGNEILSSSDDALTTTGKGGVGGGIGNGSDTGGMHLDNFLIEDAASGTTYDESVSDGAVAGDTFTAAFTAADTLTEGVKAGETFGSAFTAADTLTEGALAGDTVSSLAVLSDTLTEGVLAGDTVAGLADMPNALTEGVLAGDTVVGGTAVSDSVSEGVLAGDTETSSLVQFGTVSEGAVAGDAESSAIVLGGLLSEGVLAGDAQTGQMAGVASVSEGAVAGDAETGIMASVASVTEGALAGDTETVTGVTNLFLTEGVLLGDQFSPPDLPTGGGVRARLFIQPVVIQRMRLFPAIDAEMLMDTVIDAELDVAAL